MDIERLVANAASVEDLPSLEDVRKAYTLSVIQRVRGNLSHTARVLGIDRRTLYRQLAAWKIRVERRTEYGVATEVILHDEAAGTRTVVTAVSAQQARYDADPLGTLHPAHEAELQAMERTS